MMEQLMRPMSQEEARRFATGVGGDIMVKYPLQYCKAAFLGERPKQDGVSKISNGTATFLELATGTYAVTCAHVVDAYFDFRRSSDSALFQIGMTELSLEDQLTDKNDTIDLATIKLTEAQANELANQGEIGCRVIRPSQWPPRPVEQGERVMFGGFPGCLRERLAFDDLQFGSFSAAGIAVASSYADRFTCVLERDFWVSSLEQPYRSNPVQLKELGGLSGGPAFIDRGIHFEFVGLIYQHSEAFDILFFRPAALIQSDGRIRNAI